MCLIFLIFLCQRLVVTALLYISYLHIWVLNILNERVVWAHSGTQKRRKYAYVYKTYSISMFFHVKTFCCHFCLILKYISTRKEKVASMLAKHGDSLGETCSSAHNLPSRSFVVRSILGDATQEDLKFLIQATSWLFIIGPRKVNTHKSRAPRTKHCQSETKLKTDAYSDTNHVIHINIQRWIKASRKNVVI